MKQHTCSTTDSATCFVLLTAGAQNGGQQLNVRLANSLHYLQNQVNRMLSNMGDTLPVNAVNIIAENVKGLLPLTGAILQPLVGMQIKQFPCVSPIECVICLFVQIRLIKLSKLLLLRYIWNKIGIGYKSVVTKRCLVVRICEN